MHTFMQRNILFDIYSPKRIIHSIILYTAYCGIFTISAVAAFLITVNPPLYLSDATDTLVIIILVKFFISHLFNIRRISLTRSINLHVIVKTCLIVTANAFCLALMNERSILFAGFPLTFFVLDALISWCGLVFFYFVFAEVFAFSRTRHAILSNNTDNETDRTNTLIIGTDPTAQGLCKLLTVSEYSQHKIVGFVDDDERIIGLKIQGKKVYGPLSDIRKIIESCHAETVLIACGRGCEQIINTIEKHVENLPIEIIAIPSYLDFLMKRKDVKTLEGFPVSCMLINNKKVMFTPTIITQKLDPTQR